MIVLSIGCSTPDLPQPAAAPAAESTDATASASPPATSTPPAETVAQAPAAAAEPAAPAATEPVAEVAPAEETADAEWKQFESDRQALIDKFENALRLPAGRTAADKFAADAGVTLTPDDETPCLLTFQCANGDFDKLFADHFEALKQNGWYLFRYNNSFGIGDGMDLCALLPTDDKYEVLTLVETSGPNSNVTPWQVTNWLRDLEQTQPFVLTDANFEACTGKFTKPIADPKKLADDIYEFCPDVVDENGLELSDLVESLQKPEPELHLWWD